MDAECAPPNPASVTHLRRLGLNCHYCGRGRTARFKVQYESGRTRRIDHSRTVFVCARHLPDGYAPQDIP